MPPPLNINPEKSKSVRYYGQPPYKIAVLHGGPGAPGYMAPVARELGRSRGILEPLQTESSLDGQIAELRDQLADNADFPVTLIGSSWGAVLALFIASTGEIAIEKLVLIGSAVFDAESSAKIKEVRLGRLADTDRQWLQEIESRLNDPLETNKPEIAKEWGDIFFQTDVYDAITTDLEVIEVQCDLNTKVWSERNPGRGNPWRLRSPSDRGDRAVSRKLYQGYPLLYFTQMRPLPLDRTVGEG